MYNPFEQFKIFHITEILRNITRYLNIREYTIKNFAAILQEQFIYPPQQFSLFFRNVYYWVFSKKFYDMEQFLRGYIDYRWRNLGPLTHGMDALYNEFRYTLYSPFPRFAKYHFRSNIRLECGFRYFDLNTQYMYYEWYPYSDNALIPTWEVSWHVLLEPAQDFLHQAFGQVQI